MFLTKIENGELLLELRDYFYKKSKFSKESFIERLPLRYQANKKYPKVEKYAIIFVEIYRRDGVFFMNLSIQDELQPFAEELQRYVTPIFLEELARELGFIKRKRKFSGSDLAAICIWISQRVASDPLVRLCSRLHAATGTLLSPEGLNKRLNAKAVLLLQHIFSLLLQKKYVNKRKFLTISSLISNEFVF